MQPIFLVWSSPTHGSSRSREFAKELGISELHYVVSGIERTGFTAPLRYIDQGYQTLRLLFEKRPDLIFVQSPPGFAVFFVYLYCALTGSRYIVDAHSGAFDLPIWTHPGWFYRFLARKALVTIVTDAHFQQTIERWGGRAFVLKDPVTSYSWEKTSLKSGFNLTVVNSFSDDEPLEEVLKAAADLEDVRFYITGKIRDADPRLLRKTPPNVQYTDFLPNPSYYGLLNASDAVMCLTTNDHTLQCGACEALSLGKPVITSDWPLLREYFCKGSVLVQNNREEIRQGILEMKKNHHLYLSGIQELRVEHQREWKMKVHQLLGMVQMPSYPKGGPVTG